MCHVLMMTNPEDKFARRMFLVTSQRARVQQGAVSVQGGHHDVRNLQV